jgi:heme ABC exporter ATP-binding subunit CcmA
MEPLVHLRDAVVLLGRFPALAGVDLDIDPGQIVLLRGPNGAGKTTLLRLCAGLLPLTRGSGQIAGIDLVAEPLEVRRRVGLLGHANGLYDDLTVRDNVRFWGRTAGAQDDEIDGALARLGLGGRLADVSARKLSAGQRRRTALAALLVRRPQLWLLDEPHAGLDAETRDVLDTLLKTAVSSGATVLLASHELERAGELADRVVSVVAGRVVEEFPNVA